GLLVPGNGARRKDDGIAGTQRNRLHLFARQFGKSRQGLALATGADYDQVLARDETVILFGHEFREAVHVAELGGDIDDPLEGAAEQQALPPGITYSFGDGADTPDIGRESGDRHPALRAGDDFLEAGADRL